MASGAMAASFSTASREPCAGFGTFAERRPRVTAMRARATLAALGGLGGGSVGRVASSAAWRKAGFGSRARRTVDRRTVVVPRARAGDASGSKWVRGLGASPQNGEDPITGALHQSRGLRERLADLAGGGKKPISGADGKPWNDESDWEHWLEVIDKADAEDQILTALEVRLHVGRSQRVATKAKRLFLESCLFFPVDAVVARGLTLLCLSLSPFTNTYQHAFRVSSTWPLNARTSPRRLR